ncbi:F-box/kelch-repeat protein At5g15710-like [Wolffia australiana]
MAEDQLPDCLWEKVFSLLPVSSLISARTVCRRWNHIIRSDIFSLIYSATSPCRFNLVDDVIFVLFADLDCSDPFAAAYQASSDRWIPFPLSRFFGNGFRGVLASGGPLFLSENGKLSLLLCNLFSGTACEIPAMISSHGQSYVLGMIDYGAAGYQIVSVSTADRVLSQMFDSRTGDWELKGQILGKFAVLGNSAYLDGILYILSRGPDHLLAFDLNSGDWAVLDVAMPSSCVVCSHILVHGGCIFLIAGLEEEGDICEIVFWVLDLKEKNWNLFGCMPKDLLEQFRGHRLYHFYTVDLKGLVCFCNTSCYTPLMCDLRGMKWWWPRRCPFKIPMNAQTWFGHALEPRI